MSNTAFGQLTTIIVDVSSITWVSDLFDAYFHVNLHTGQYQGEMKESVN